MRVGASREELEALWSTLIHNSSHVELATKGERKALWGRAGDISWAVAYCPDLGRTPRDEWDRLCSDCVLRQLFEEGHIDELYCHPSEWVSRKIDEWARELRER